MLLVPDSRKLRQEIVRSTCMDPMGHIRPDYVSYVAAPIFADGAPLGNFCVFSRKTLKELGWTVHHTTILRGLADAASTEVSRKCLVYGYAQPFLRTRLVRNDPHDGFANDQSVVVNDGCVDKMLE